MKHLVIILAVILIGCAGHDPEIDSNRIINPGGGRGQILYTASGDTLHYSFSDTAWIGLPDVDRWQWHHVISGSIDLDIDGEFTFAVVADGGEVTVLYLSVE